MEATPVKLIVGLGNPGEKYSKTRHNAGFLFIDRLCEQLGVTLKSDKNTHGLSTKTNLGDHQIMLLKPTTYMNLSGQSVGAACRYYKCQMHEILVVHDEIDLDPGIARLKLGGGHGGNNGLRDIIQKSGTNEFARLRLGVGHPGVGRDVANFVLKTANKADQEQINLAIDESLRVIRSVVAGEFSLAMNELHTALK